MRSPKRAQVDKATAAGLLAKNEFVPGERMLPQYEGVVDTLV